jgi:hypothetical protein
MNIERSEYLGGSEEGSHFRRIDFCITLGSTVIKKKKKYLGGVKGQLALGQRLLETNLISQLVQ